MIQAERCMCCRRGARGCRPGAFRLAAALCRGFGASHREVSRGTSFGCGFWSAVGSAAVRAVVLVAGVVSAVVGWPARSVSGGAAGAGHRRRRGSCWCVAVAGCAASRRRCGRWASWRRQPSHGCRGVGRGCSASRRFCCTSLVFERGSFASEGAAAAPATYAIHIFKCAGTQTSAP